MTNVDTLPLLDAIIIFSLERDNKLLLKKGQIVAFVYHYNYNQYSYITSSNQWLGSAGKDVDWEMRLMLRIAV